MDPTIENFQWIPLLAFLIWFPLGNPNFDFNDFYVWVLLIIMKILWFYLLSLIPLVISLCLSSRLRAKSTVVTSMFKDLYIQMPYFSVHGWWVNDKNFLCYLFLTYFWVDWFMVECLVFAPTCIDLVFPWNSSDQYLI